MKFTIEITEHDNNTKAKIQDSETGEVKETFAGSINIAINWVLSMSRKWLKEKYE